MNKESVLAFIAEQGFRRLTAAMRAAAEPHAGDPLAMLRSTGMAYLDVAISFPHHLQVMFSDLIASHDPYPSLLEASREAYEFLVSVVRLGMDSGRLSAPSERVAVLAAWSQVHGLALLIASGQVRAQDGKPDDYRALAESVLKLQQQGIAAQTVRVVHKAVRKRARRH